MSRPKFSNPTILTQLISTVSAAALADRHRALIVLKTPPDGALGVFAATHELTFIGTRHAADRADRITDVLGREFDILIHETRDDLDAGLLAALAGTVKASGVLILGLPFDLDPNAANSTISRFATRFVRLLSDMRPMFPGKVLLLQHLPDSDNTALKTIFQPISLQRYAVQAREHSHSATSGLKHITADQEQKTLLKRACDYLERHPRGCTTITGRRGRGKSALLGQLANWLNGQNITFAVTAARQSALASLHRHSTGHCDFLAPPDAHRSGCQVLLVEEASSLPLSLLESFLETHQHVIYCSTVEGYENAGRAFAVRFSQLLEKRYAHALTLQPSAPWRWDAGDPLEYFIDTLLLGGNDKADHTLPPVSARNTVTSHTGTDTVVKTSPPGQHIRMLDRAELALDEAMLRQVYGLLRDTHYQTSAADLSHMLDAPGLQLWILEEGGLVKAALMLVLEGDIDPCLHEAIVSKRRRLPHQLLPQLLAQSANETQALTATIGRVIRIAVADPVRRRGLGSQLLHSVETATMTPEGNASGLGASFASDKVSVAFWQRNGYIRFHTGFRSNPRTGKPAVAVIKSHDPVLKSVVQLAVTIHDDNLRWIRGDPQISEKQGQDTELLRRFINNQRSVHDTFAALSRLAKQHNLPLQHDLPVSRRKYESTLREAVAAALA